MSGNTKEYESPQNSSLQPHQYVWIKINLHATLCREFWVQSLEGGEGTFPIDSSLDHWKRVWSLVDDFLELRPSEEREGEMEFPGLMFRPRHHLVLIDQILCHHGVSARVFPVHKAKELGSSSEDGTVFDRLLRPTLVPIISADETQDHLLYPDNAIRLRTTSGPLVQEPILQNVYNSPRFVIGSVIRDDSDAVSLDSTSIEVFRAIAAVSHEKFNEDYPKALALNGVQTKGKMGCGCLKGVHPKLFENQASQSWTHLSDIVIKVAHRASLDEVAEWTGGTTLHEDVIRTTQIVELFAQWLPYSRGASN